VTKEQCVADMLNFKPGSSG